MGALQKFSLRRQAQTTMIEEDLIKWIGQLNSPPKGHLGKPLVHFELQIELEKLTFCIPFFFVSSL